MNNRKDNNVPDRNIIGSSNSTPSTTTSGTGRLPSTPLMREGDPKPAKMDNLVDWKDFIPGILNEAGDLNNKQVLWNLQRAAGIMKSRTGLDYWNTDDG